MHNSDEGLNRRNVSLSEEIKIVALFKIIDSYAGLCPFAGMHLAPLLALYVYLDY